MAKELAGRKPQAQPGVLTISGSLPLCFSALCVRYVIASHLDKTQIPAAYTRGKGWRIAWLFLAALFTFGLQVMLECKSYHIHDMLALTMLLTVWHVVLPAFSWYAARVRVYKSADGHAFLGGEHICR